VAEAGAKRCGCSIHSLVAPIVEQDAQSRAGVEAELRLGESCKDVQGLLSAKAELEGQLKRARHLAQRLRALPTHRVRDSLQGRSIISMDGNPASSLPAGERSLSQSMQEVCSVDAIHIILL
jgi:hypothetical protein